MALGAVFLAGALYVGFHGLLVWLCLAAALTCFVYAAWLITLRRRYRRPRPTPALDETGEALQAMARRFH